MKAHTVKIAPLLLVMAAACGESSDAPLPDTTSGESATSPSSGGQSAAPETMPEGTMPPMTGAGGAGEPSTAPARAANDEAPGAGAELEETPLAPSGGGSTASPDETDPTAPPPEPEPEPEAFAPCPTDGTPCAIMPLGDSITFGIGSSGGGYRVELFRQALQNQRSIRFVGTAMPNGPQNVNNQPFPRDHQGHSGFTISGGGAGSLAGLVDDAIEATDPNIILLLIGTNDMNGNIDLANAPRRLGLLLDQLTDAAPEALLVVAQIVPITVANTNTRVQAYNAAIPALVQERVAAGKHLALVDMYTAFVADPNFAATLMNDFLHPNDAGYVVMGRQWYSAIEGFLPD